MECLRRSAAAWRTVQSLDFEQLAATCDVQRLEDIIDSLLSCDITAVDPCSMSINSYLQLLQPLQLSLQYTWFLYSRDSRRQGVAARCLTAANAFSGGLRRYLKAAQTDLSALHRGSATQLQSEALPTQLQSEALRTQLKPLKKLHDASRLSMKAEEAQEQDSQFEVGSRSLAIEWAVLHAVTLPDLANSEDMAALCSVLPTLAYGNVSQQPWQDLTASNCIQFIQLAQVAVQYMLAEAHAVHSKLGGTRQQLHKQECAVKQLHQRSKACFHQLRLAQKGHPAECSQLSSIGAVQHVAIQPEHAEVSTPSALDQPLEASAAALTAAQSSRSVSPVKGSLVQYRASSDCPVLVQGSTPQLAAQQPAAQQPVPEEASLTASLQDQDSHGQSVLMEGSPQQDYGTAGIEAILRSEQSELHEARSQVAELWLAMASFGQDGIIVGQEDDAGTFEACIPDQNSSEPRRSSISSQTSAGMQHTTSLSLDLEALRAAERRHAEARIRATFDDIKQKAFLDVTQRIHRSSSRLDTGTAHQNTLGSARSGMQPLADSMHQGTQPLQHFRSDASVSQIVEDLRVSSGMQRNTSLDLTRQHSAARPPKARHVRGSSLSSNSSLPWTKGAGNGQGMQKVALPFKSVVSSPNNLMRLTSCVKLSASE